MVLSATTSRLRSRDMPAMYLRIPTETLGNLFLEWRSSPVISVNVILTCINFLAQNIVLTMKAGHNDYDIILSLVSFGAALITCIGAFVSLNAYKSMPELNGRCKFNFFLALVMLGFTAHAAAVNSDHRIWVFAITYYLLVVARRSSPTEEGWFLLAGREKRSVPVLVTFGPGGEVVTDIRVSTEHVHLLTSVYRGHRNEALSAAEGRVIIERYLADAPRLSE